MWQKVNDNPFFVSCLGEQEKRLSQIQVGFKKSLSF